METEEHVPPQDYRAAGGSAITLQRVTIAAAVLAVVGGTMAISAAIAPSPIPVNVPDVERRFDHASGAAMADYSGHPLLVTGEVASVHDDRITFKTIYVLNVQAYFSESTVGMREGETVTLNCADIYRQEYLGGDKPAFRGCRRT